MNDRLEHIESEVLQAYLEGEVPEDRSAEVDSHLAVCARCAEELDGWRVLFRDLGTLPALGPSSAFSDRVMARLRPAAVAPAPRPLRERILSLLRGAGKKGARHPAPRALQDFADGVLAGPELAAATVHLAACAECEKEVEAWHGLVAALAALPVLRPSEGFAARVMGNVRARRATAAPPAPRPTERLLAAARWLVPTTRKGWIAASSVVAAPVAGFLALMGIVAVHPLLTLGDLFAFFGWQGSALARNGFGWIVQEIVGSGLVLQAYEALQVLVAAPGMLAGAAALTWLATVTAGWVMYRNVLAPFLPSRHRVRTG
ncbi:MAG: zf-HC2 domain-containing protein [Gemmatimonadota bacterium]